MAERGEHPWQACAPSAIPYADGWPTPTEMSEDDIARAIQAFGEAARRSAGAGFKIIEVYAAHGFLVHQFLSPISNQRQDRWGGSAENRRRFALAVAKSIRENRPLHGAARLSQDENHALWPIESGWWLMKRDRLLKKLGIR